MKKHLLFAVLLLVVAGLATAWGAPIKAYVAEFAVTGVQNRDELKTTLQTLFMSRLASDRIVPVDKPAGAEVMVSGSYVVFGKVFSIDVAARNSAGSVLARAFVQGESQDELIPAMGKLAQALADGIVKVAAPAGPSPMPAAPLPQAPQVQEAPRPAVGTPPSSEIIRPAQTEKVAGAGWVSQRLTGAMNGLAVGRTFPNGERELFITGKRTIQYYRQGKEMKLLAEVAVKVDEKILGVETADLDGDGNPEVYVTVLRGDELASQAWTVDGNGLKKVADSLPYFFRAISLEGGTKKLYAQQMSSDADFYGDVFEVVKSGDTYALKNPLKLPRLGYLYNFNIFRDAQGKSHVILFDRDGYIRVYSPEGEELWKSSDKFSGSELYFQRPDPANQRITGDSFRWIFLDQRIAVTREGEIIIPQNSGFWVMGNSRSYSKNSLFGFAWNGSSLEEKWHTRQSQNYLADFAYDGAGRELLLLEVVKKEGLLDKGASALAIKRLE